MHKLKQVFRKYYEKVTSGIAFFPAMITLFLALLGLFFIEYEGQEIKQYLSENASFLVLKDKDTARSFLSAEIGGMISLTVFSFSMVMILLNQASSNYSPRLLPGLISNRNHQIVLGTYLGTIIFATIIMLNIQPNADNLYDLPALGFIAAIVLLIFCLAMFIYFINTISNAIKVGTILTNLYHDTQKDLNNYKDHLEDSEFSGANKMTQTWTPISCDRVGYFKDSEISQLLNITEQEDFQIRFEVSKGDFILKNRVILSASKPLDQETIAAIDGTLNFSVEETASSNYYYGFKHITEIALKAMSPGVNDPGTALNALDYLTDLFALKMSVDEPLLFGRDGMLRIITKRISFQSLLNYHVTQLREYTKHDAILMAKINGMLDYLLSDCNASTQQIAIIKEEIEKLTFDVSSNIENKEDQDKVFD